MIEINFTWCIGYIVFHIVGIIFSWVVIAKAAADVWWCGADDNTEIVGVSAIIFSWLVGILYLIIFGVKTLLKSLTNKFKKF